MATKKILHVGGPLHGKHAGHDGSSRKEHKMKVVGGEDGEHQVTIYTKWKPRMQAEQPSVEEVELWMTLSEEERIARQAEKQDHPEVLVAAQDETGFLPPDEELVWSYADALRRAHLPA